MCQIKSWVLFVIHNSCIECFLVFARNLYIHINFLLEVSSTEGTMNHLVLCVPILSCVAIMKVFPQKLQWHGINSTWSYSLCVTVRFAITDVFHKSYNDMVWIAHGVILYGWQFVLQLGMLFHKRYNDMIYNYMSRFLMCDSCNFNCLLCAALVTI